MIPFTPPQTFIDRCLSLEKILKFFTELSSRDILYEYVRHTIEFQFFYLRIAQ